MYLIAFLMIIFLLLLLLIILFAVVPMKVAVAFNSEQQPEIYATATWLTPFLQFYINGISEQILLTIYLFNKKILTKDLKDKQSSYSGLAENKYTKYSRLLRILHLDNVKLFASYGFEDPSITGMLCGAIDLLSQYIVLEDFYNNADFSLSYNYFNISATAELNVTISLLNILRKRFFKSNLQTIGNSK